MRGYCCREFPRNNILEKNEHSITEISIDDLGIYPRHPDNSRVIIPKNMKRIQSFS